LSSDTPAPAGSVSRIECVATVRGKGEARIALYRHMAPLTVNAILRSLPFDSRVSVQPPLVSLITDLKIGVEKPKTQFSRGDVAYLASGGLICIFLGDARSDRPLNPIGKVEAGLQIFDAMKAGEVVTLTSVPPVQSDAV
jgi:hypothetical protein